METVDVLSPSVADASVRPATAADLPAIGGINARSWTTAYRSLFPARVLERLTPAALTEAWRPHLAAAGRPMHHLLVACTGPTVVGFGAFGPATGQRDVPPDAAELTTLLVDAVHQRHGHGSRLLAAGVDLLRADGAGHLVCWVPDADAPRLAFLQSAGFEPDGAWRRLAPDGPDDDPDEPSDGAGAAGVREVRLVAGLGAAG